MAEWRYVTVERRGPVGIITLNRPEKLNAMNAQLGADMAEAVDLFERDDEVRAIVVTGAGDRAFSAGADMKEQASRIHETGSRPAAASHYQRVRDCPKPTLAAIRGICYGGGCVLATNCDIRICGDDTRFRFVGATYGLAAAGAMLPRIVGEGKAKELLFTADVVDAREALRIGLANHVVPTAEVLEYTVAMAERIAANSPGAVRALKEIVDVALSAEAAVAKEAELTRQLRASPDHAERFTAAAKRVVGQLH